MPSFYTWGNQDMSKTMPHLHPQNSCYNSTICDAGCTEIGISSVKNRKGKYYYSHFKRVDLELNFGLETEMPQQVKALMIQ